MARVVVTQAVVAAAVVAVGMIAEVVAVVAIGFPPPSAAQSLRGEALRKQ